MIKSSYMDQQEQDSREDLFKLRPFKILASMKIENDNDRFMTLPVPEQEQLTNIVGNRRLKLRNTAKQRLYRRKSQKSNVIH